MTRRTLLAAAAAAALARPAAAGAQAREPEVLVRLIALEEAAARAHRVAGVAPAFAGHEAAHARALRTELAALGLEAPAAGLDPAAADLARIRSRAAAIALETALVDAYRRAVLELTEPSIMRTAATILAGHSQHRTLLAGRPGRYPPG